MGTGSASIADVVGVNRSELDLGTDRAVAHGPAVTYIHQAAPVVVPVVERWTTTG